MHFGLFFVGLLAGGTAAVAAFDHGGGMVTAVLAYALCSLGSVFFAAVIWALAPAPRPAALPDRGSPGI